MKKHGAQLYIGGHKHVQEFLETGCAACNGIPQVVTGAGGGIGTQAGYGFFSLEVTMDIISVQLISDKRNQTYKVLHPSLRASRGSEAKVLDALMV